MQYETMTQSEALNVVSEFSTSTGMGLLETMEWMQENYHELDSVEKCSFRTAFRGFQRLFQPVTTE